jgi:hypothetical protein
LIDHIKEPILPRPKKSVDTSTAPKAFTHDSSTRTGLPSGGTAGKAPVPKAPKRKYWYNPHLSPVLRHDPTGKAGREPLNAEEKKLLEEALRNHQPWLEWSGKREAEEKGYFEVDPVALSIHARVSLRRIGQIALSPPRFVAPSAMPDSAVGKPYMHNLYQRAKKCNFMSV